MIRIAPDKEGRLTQWDKDRKVIVTGVEGGAEIHFASPGDDHGAYVVELADGEAAVPNILLTMAGTINVYVYPADRTIFAATLPVMAREKPDDYIYTETEVLSYKTLDEKIGDLAELETAAKENLVAAINEAAKSGITSIYMRVAEGYIEYSGNGETWEKLIAVDELKGPKGDKGDKGEKGDPGEIIVANVTYSSEDEKWHCDMTYEEMNAVKYTHSLYVKYNTQMYPYMFQGATNGVACNMFGALWAYGTDNLPYNRFIIWANGDVWANAYHAVVEEALAQTITAGSADDVAPSAKAVADYVAAQLGDITSLINAI